MLPGGDHGDRHPGRSGFLWLVVVAVEAGFFPPEKKKSCYGSCYMLCLLWVRIKTYIQIDVHNVLV